MRTIHKTLGYTDENYDVTKNLFTEYFASKINYTFERSKFRMITPGKDESAAHYIIRLKSPALMCNFDDYTTENAICDQFIKVIKGY